MLILLQSDRIVINLNVGTSKEEHKPKLGLAYPVILSLNKCHYLREMYASVNSRIMYSIDFCLYAYVCAVPSK